MLCSHLQLIWLSLQNFDCNMSELVRLLMRIIGASAAPEDAQQEANQESPARLAKKGYSQVGGATITSRRVQMAVLAGCTSNHN